ncbi:MAG: glutamate 5-kinase [Pirellulaceae bacterium]|nr:glutamate 5-kinase [Pirellulaceae bacterium]
MNSLPSQRSLLTSAETIVVKVGSRVLSHQGRLDEQRVRSLARQLVQVADMNKQVVLVSSGAVASGIGKLGLEKRPVDVPQLQAVAAVGQAHLIQAYERYFTEMGRHAAQILLIADDLDDRTRYLNVRNTLLACLQLGLIPVINENDTVAIEELQTTFGDNDRLAAMVAGVFSRPALIILSDVDGVYDRSPSDSNARVVSQFDQVDQSVLNLASAHQAGVSKGGMASKLRVAQFVTQSGAPVVIAGGRIENVLPRLMNGEPLGTLFLPRSAGLTPRKRWLGFSTQPAGRIQIDAGAVRALRVQGSSLLPVGVTEIVGGFAKGEVVSVMSDDGVEVARGLTNYNDAQLRQIRGLRTWQIEEVLGQCPYAEVIHRDNMTLL